MFCFFYSGFMHGFCVYKRKLFQSFCINIAGGINVGFARGESCRLPDTVCVARCCRENPSAPACSPASSGWEVLQAEGQAVTRTRLPCSSPGPAQGIHYNFLGFISNSLFYACSAFDRNTDQKALITPDDYYNQNYFIHSNHFQNKPDKPRHIISQTKPYHYKTFRLDHFKTKNRKKTPVLSKSKINSWRLNRSGDGRVKNRAQPGGVLRSVQIKNIILSDKNFKQIVLNAFHKIGSC